MGKLGGIILLSALALSGSAAPAEARPEPVAVVQPLAGPQAEMLTALRTGLVTLKASDSALTSEAHGACVNLVFHSKDEYREDVMKRYADVTLAVDHLTVAAAAKRYLCR